MPSVPVRCVQVDNADHMYLAGPTWIPTHNSTLALDLARAASITHGHGHRDLQPGDEPQRDHHAAAIRRGPRRRCTTCGPASMSDDDWTRLARRMSEVADAPLFIDDSPNMSMMEIRAKCRRLKQRHDLKLVIIDYLQLMSSPKRVENRQQEVSELSRSLKLLAKELEVPVVALSQLNRGPEQRTDKRRCSPTCVNPARIEQDADVVILLHREDAYERGVPPRGRGRPDRGQAPQRPDGHGHRRLPGPLQPLRGHGDVSRRPDRSGSSHCCCLGDLVPGRCSAALLAEPQAAVLVGVQITPAAALGVGRAGSGVSWIWASEPPKTPPRPLSRVYARVRARVDRLDRGQRAGVVGRVDALAGPTCGLNRDRATS